MYVYVLKVRMLVYCVNYYEAWCSAAFYVKSKLTRAIMAGIGGAFFIFIF